MKKFTLLVLALTTTLCAMASSLPIDLIINKKIDSPWSYIPNDSNYMDPKFYNNEGGLKMDWEGKGVQSPKFDVVDSVKVSFYIAALNINNKAAGDADYQFEVIALDSNGVALDTAGVDSIIDPAWYAVKLYHDDIAQIQVRMTRFVSTVSKCYNAELTKVKIEVADGSGVDNGLEVVEVEDILAFYNFADQTKLAKITGAIHVVYHYGNNVYVTDNSAALLIHDEKFGEMEDQLENGQTITGIVGKYSLFEENPQMNDVREVGVVAAEGEVVLPFDADPNELMEGDMYEYVRFSNVSFIDDVTFYKDSIATNAYISVVDSFMVVRNHFKIIEGTYAAGSVVTVEGVLQMFAGRLQLYLTKLELISTDVEDVVASDVPVFVRGNDIVVMAEEGTEVKVFTVSGHQIYDGVTNSGETVIAGMQSGALIVIVGSEVTKVII